MRYPLSFAQRRLHAPDQHLPYAVRLAGALDRDALQRAVDALVARHAALRTVVVPPEQVVADTGVTVEHAVLPEADAEAFALAQAARPFDLARGPLLRAALVETGPDRWVFVLVAHRVVADEAGLAVLLKELGALYRDPSAVLPQLWMDYGDYAVWQLDRLRGAELARQLEPWCAPLRAAPRELFPHRRAARSTRADVVTATVDAAGPHLVLAAYAAVLSRLAQQRDLVIGLPVDGRVRPELVPIVGPFADTVPVRLTVADGPFAQLLDQVREVAAEARAHAELPYELLAAELGLAAPAVRFGGPPALPAPALPGVTAGGRIAFPATTESDLDLMVSADGTLTLGYRTDLFDAPFATHLLRSVVTVVEHATRSPELTIAELPLPAAESVIGPRDPVETDMVGIWTELLQPATPIGVHDNLFVLGSNSLTAMRFAARIADSYGVQLSMHSIVAGPTVAQLAEVVTGTTAAETAAAEPDPGLAALSDTELDELLRAVLADRDRRRGAEGSGR